MNDLKDQSIEEWTFSKCPCGQASCNSVTLDFAGCEGKLDEETAKLICSIPHLFEIIEYQKLHIQSLEKIWKILKVNNQTQAKEVS